MSVDTAGIQPGRTVRRRTLAAALIATLSLLVVGLLAYIAGESKAGSRLKVLTGNAYVGDRQASVSVGGWAYGIQDSVAWTDADGSVHDGGWPACLAPVGSTVRIRFGEVPLNGKGLGGSGLRAVVWVDCRGAIQVH